MLRKQIIDVPSPGPIAMPGRIDVAAVATVIVNFESPDHPIDLAFDSLPGPGGSRCKAGEQSVILHFDVPKGIIQPIQDVE